MSHGLRKEQIRVDLLVNDFQETLLMHLKNIIKLLLSIQMYSLQFSIF